MKNIHLIATDKPSRLHFDGKLFLSPNYQVRKRIDYNVEGRNIYITSDEEAEEGDWVIYRNSVFKIERGDDVLFDLINVDFRKVILTTDQDLIKDGVQDIDDEFLEWFVKNPSYEFVEVKSKKIRVDKNFNDISHWNRFKYEIIIPQEDPKFISGQPFLEKADEVIVIHRPKQETLEEAVNAFKKTNVYTNEIKQKQERSYSEEEMLEFSEWVSHNDWVYLPSKGYWVNEEQEELEENFTTKELFEQFKKR
jgi:hypothetical protein